MLRYYTNGDKLTLHQMNIHYATVVQGTHCPLHDCMAMLIIIFVLLLFEWGITKEHYPPHYNILIFLQGK
jgi:hypothetical protein